MKQHSFERRHRMQWQQLEATLENPKAPLDQHFPEQFRQLCHQLSLAKHRRYSPQLVDRLNEIVIKAHHRFYQHKYRLHFQWLTFFVHDFPHTVRRNRNFVLSASALFLLPLLATAITCFINPEFIYSIASYEQVKSMEAMYDPSNRVIGRERESDTNLYMFGYYIYNNIGISFRTFAGGVLFGLGTVFFLVFNGLFIGAVGGHLTQMGFGSTFYPFIAGHGAFELTAIALAGAAGLKLGYAMVHPGQKPWIAALREAGRDAVLIIYGTTAMLLIAAFIEAFWSSSNAVGPSVKYLVGIGFWLLVISYLAFSGRRYGSRSY
ncbi:MAG: stage II sporulation protein M [Cellvibrionaceae bacterium]|nr:stage II sporulation protein M [Cellvibrionaceae bacterium]